MPATLVGRAQAAGIHHALTREANRVLERRTANEAHIAHLIEISLPPERAGEGDLAGIILGSHFQFQGLAAYRVGIVRVAGQPKTLRRQDADAFSFVLHRDRLADAQVAALPA